MKGDVVTNALTIVGIAAVSALMFSKVPGMIDDIQLILSKTSVTAKASEISDLITISLSAPSDIKINYTFPAEETYTLTIKDGYVTVASSASPEPGVSKTISKTEFGPETVTSIVINKGRVEAVK